VGDFQTQSQAWADHILQTEPDNNDYLLVIPADDTSVGVHAAHQMGGTPVPEPSTIAAVLGGVFWIAWSRRSRRRV
jgi:hypothetical protein